MPEVVVIDYGMGNLRSIANALRAVGADVEVSSDPDTVASAERLVLPGVGAFGRAMQEIDDRQLMEPIVESIRSGQPLLGICVGYQVLFEGSTEQGRHRGIGLFSGCVERFDDESLIVPHMGWNRIEILREHSLFDGVPSGSFVYFVHSYRPVDVPSEQALTTTPYEDDFVSAIARDNVVGCQFHPEKSGTVGLRILENFLRWRPR